MRTLTENERKLIMDSGLFDAAWYAATYRDVASMGLEPLEHFVRIGIYIGRNPCRLFDGKHYLSQVSGKRPVEIPLLDYLSVGWREHLSPHPLFCLAWYLERNEDIVAAGIEPLAHFFHHGGLEGRQPHPAFPTHRVLERHPHLRETRRNPLEYYLSREWTEDPCLEASAYLARWRKGMQAIENLAPTNLHGQEVKHLFDSDYYLFNNEDVRRAAVNPEEHYWSSGEREGRWPNAHFDPVFYLKTNADVRVAKVSPFRHFIDAGAREGRLGCSPIDTKLSPRLNAEKPVLFVGHDGIQAGSETVLLEVIRWFNKNTLRRIKLLLLNPGPMISSYAKYCDLYVVNNDYIDQIEVLKEFLNEKFEFIYLNTVVSGIFLKITEEYDIEINAPIISHIHEMEKVLDIYLTELERLKKHVCHWISASPASTSTLSEKHGVIASNITTVSAFIRPLTDGGVNFNDFKDKARNSLGIADDVFLVMGCGTVYWRKGVDIFVDTARLIRSRTNRPIAFVWLGDGPDRSKLEGSLSREERGYITFAGNREDANFLLAAADVFMLSSREDPFPLVVLEAAQHGVPSICFAPATGIIEFIEKDAGIALPQVSSEGAADAILVLMKNITKREQLGKTARLKMFEKYTAEKQNIKIYEAIRRHSAYRPSISVIVPFYNHEKFVKERIDSILNQTVQDFEIIILDDCSTDQTVEVIKPYLIDSRIRIIKNDQNSGSPFKQWQKGIYQARSEIIWIAEGDDSCDPNFISTLLPYFDDQMVNIAAAKTEIIDERSNEQPNALDSYLEIAHPNKFKNNYITDGFIEVNQYLGAICTLVNASGLLLRKNCIGAILTEALEWKMCGDWLIYLECLRNGKIAYDVNTRNLFRRHIASQVNKIEGTKTYFLERSKITEYVLDKYHVSTELVAKIFSSIDHEWARFQHKNPNNKLEDYYNKRNLEKKAKYRNSFGHVGFYVHGMTFSMGGIERLASHLANHLVEIGWNVTIYCSIHKYKNSIYPLYDSVRLKPIFDETKIDQSTSNLEEALCNDGVEIFVPMLSEALFEPIVKAALNAKVKIIASEHNDPWKIEELWWTKDKRVECFEKVNAIHLYLDKFKNSLPNHLRGKITVIPNGTNIPNQVNYSKREKNIISVGRLENQKRFDRLVRAIASIQDNVRTMGYRVEIYGEGQLRNILASQIKEAGISDIFFLKGKTDEIQKIYDKSSFFVLPSEFEGFGIVVIEALSYGLPVIAFKDCNGPNEIIRSNQDGLLVGSDQEMASAILRYMKNISNSERRSAYYRSHKYSLQMFFESWHNLLTKIKNNT